jgi:hypothetical protein
MGVLRIILQALQRHGERLSRGWPPILRLVSAVGRTCEDPVTVAAGFTCVECICSDLLSVLPKDFIPTALDLILDYGAHRGRGGGVRASERLSPLGNQGRGGRRGRSAVAEGLALRNSTAATLSTARAGAGLTGGSGPAAAAAGGQTAAMNTSLTAINALWNAADFIARSIAGAGGGGGGAGVLQHQSSGVGVGEEGAGEAGKGHSSESRSDLSEEQCLALMMKVGLRPGQGARAVG